jgi:hypothetical protein
MSRDPLHVARWQRTQRWRKGSPTITSMSGKPTNNDVFLSVLALDAYMRGDFKAMPSIRRIRSMTRHQERFGRCGNRACRPAWRLRRRSSAERRTGE